MYSICWGNDFANFIIPCPTTPFKAPPTHCTHYIISPKICNARFLFIFLSSQGGNTPSAHLINHLIQEYRTGNKMPTGNPRKIGWRPTWVLAYSLGKAEVKFQMHTVTLKWISLQQLKVKPSEDQPMHIQDIIVLYEFWCCFYWQHV